MQKTKSDISKEAIAARRAYQKKWRQEHPDKVRGYNRRYWEKKAQEQSTQTEQEQQSETN